MSAWGVWQVVDKDFNTDVNDPKLMAKAVCKEHRQGESW